MSAHRDAITCRATWKATFEHDVIDLRKLPTRRLVRKARAILAQIAVGTPYAHFRGKCFRCDRTIISVPLGRCYQLLFRDEKSTLRPFCCLSHQAYHHWRPHS